MALNWEVIDTHNYHYSTVETSRAQVFGGWLVKTTSYATGMGQVSSANVSTTFVPDPDKRWKV